MSTNPFIDDFSRKLADALQGTASREEIEGWIEIPKLPEHGEYAFPCFRLAKALKKAPPQIAQQLVGDIELAEDGPIAALEPTGPYLNMRVNRDRFVAWTLGEMVLPGGTRWAHSEEAAGKTVVIDYSSPNIAKPFGIGHLRSTVIGHALREIYESQGWKVVGINHLGDWGTQFGKLIEAFERWGDDTALEEQPIRHLYDLYVRFHKEAETDPALEEAGRAWFKRLEDGDPEVVAKWQRFREMSLADFQRIYAMLGVDKGFDSYSGEAFYNDRLAPLLKRLEALPFVRESEGALVADLEDDGLGIALLRKTDGATLYATRDIAAALYRHETYGFDRMLYVVGAAQQLHFKQVFKILEKMGYEWATECRHIEFGLIQGISTRKGTLVFLEDVLEEAIERVYELTADRDYSEQQRREISRNLGIGAVIFSDLSNRRIKDVEFSWERILNFDGETGPYVTYTLVRCHSILRKFGAEPPSCADFSPLTDDASFAVVKQLELLPRAIRGALHNNEPSLVASWMLRLAQAFNKFYLQHQVIGSGEAEAARLALTQAVLVSLHQGMELIGLRPMERM